MITGTIVVCTRNRAGVLRQCLATLATQLAEPGQLDVLVVDNGSTDGTAELLAAWAGAGEGRRVLTHPPVGLSGARNAALRATRADVVLYTDDDALTPPTWARTHLAAYADPEVGSVGGPIGLTWPAGRPAWLGDDLVQWYSALDLGDEGGTFPTDHGPYGANVSVRRHAAAEAGGYDHALGRAGARLLSGEEPDLTRRLRAAGWRIVYVPEAAVVHQVLPDRIDRRWLVRRGFAQGVTNARLADRSRPRPRSRRDDIAGAAAALRTSRDLLTRRRSAAPAGPSDAARPDAARSATGLADTVLAAVHAGSAIDQVRASLRPRRAAT